jgi:orotidine-5'-phosphate decarboxylase
VGRVIVALDVPSTGDALSLVDRLGEDGDFFKVGLELYTGAGPSVVEELVERGKRVFLDLKLHDIPNTVASAVRVASELGVDLLTVHTVGGARMLDAAAEAASGPLELLGVTVLTSMTPDEMSTVWGREIRSVRDEVGRLVDVAREAGLHGVVASALEASWIRHRVGEDLRIVTPGIRPAGADRDDQTRVATPADAIRAGADYLVVGRAVTRATDPAAALRALLDETRRALAAAD